LDRATKIYAAVLLAGVAALLFSIFYENPQVARLNDLLEADPQVSAFPYPFHVVRLEDGTAVMSTPRNTSMPVYRVLGVLFPGLAGQHPDDPDFQAAQKRLAQTQKRARKLVIDQPEVKAVRWELDRQWLFEHGLLSTPN
jgi:hypothetical protein